MSGKKDQTRAGTAATQRFRITLTGDEALKPNSDRFKEIGTSRNVQDFYTLLKSAKSMPKKQTNIVSIINKSTA